MNNITTKRLIIRNFVASDADDCFDFLSDRETCYMDGGYEPYQQKDKEFYELMEQFACDSTRLALTLKGSNHVIGTIHMMKDDRRCGNACELGYVISPGYRQMGYAYEAVSAVIQYLFSDTATDMITLSAYAENIPSVRLAGKLGFTYEGIIHRGFKYPPVGIADMVSYYLDK